MAGLPPLIEEDVQLLDGALDDFLRQSEALTALIIDKGGPLLSQRGAVDKFDTTTISAAEIYAACPSGPVKGPRRARIRRRSANPERNPARRTG